MLEGEALDRLRNAMREAERIEEEERERGMSMWARFGKTVRSWGRKPDPIHIQPPPDNSDELNLYEIPSSLRKSFEEVYPLSGEEKPISLISELEDIPDTPPPLGYFNGAHTPTFFSEYISFAKEEARLLKEIRYGSNNEAKPYLLRILDDIRDRIVDQIKDYLKEFNDPEYLRLSQAKNPNNDEIIEVVNREMLREYVLGKGQRKLVEEIRKILSTIPPQSTEEKPVVDRMTRKSQEALVTPYSEFLTPDQERKLVEIATSYGLKLVALEGTQNIEERTLLESRIKDDRIRALECAGDVIYAGLRRDISQKEGNEWYSVAVLKNNWIEKAGSELLNHYCN